MDFIGHVEFSHPSGRLRCIRGKEVALNPSGLLCHLYIYAIKEGAQAPSTANRINIIQVRI